MKVGLERRVKQEDWKDAALEAGNLSELMLMLGQVSEAVDFARQIFTHADRGGDDFWKIHSKSRLADALHQSGQFAEAEKRFREAESMQKKSELGNPFLYSLSGFQFCDLLLGQGKYREVMERAEKLLEIETDARLLDVPLGNLTFGRAWMNQAREKEAEKERETKNAGADWARAKAFLDQAVTGLRESGYQYYVPLALFSRAAYYRLRGEVSHAWADLNEAREIAELGSMGLHLCDYHLEAARLCETEGKRQEAEEHLLKAKDMIEKMGYLRRKEEAEKLREKEEEKRGEGKTSRYFFSPG